MSLRHTTAPGPAGSLRAARSEGEGLAASILARLPDAAVIVVDPELTVSLAAGEALTQRGFDPSTMVGRSLVDVLPAGRYERYLPLYRGALSGERSSTEVASPDGEALYVTEFSPVHDSTGALVGAMSISHEVTEARRAQQALAASEREFRMLAEEATDLISRFALDGTYLYASPASERILGYAPAELIGRSRYDFLHPDDISELQTFHARVLEGQDTSMIRFRLMHKAGHAVVVESNVRRLRDPETGATIEIHAVTRDIGERLEAAARREQWEQSFAGTTRGICVADSGGLRITSVNRAFAEMHGGTEQDFVGRPITSFLPAELHAGLPEVVARTERLGFVRAESEHVRLDGTRFPVRTEVLAPGDEQGRSAHHIAWFEDLTEQRAAETARAEAAKIVETAFAQAPMGVALIAMDGELLRVNAVLCELLGAREDELLGGTLARFRHPDDEQITAGAYQHAHRTDEPVAVEKRYVRPDGELVWVSARGVSVWSEEGEPLHIVSHFEDITARKQAERLRAEAHARFETAFADAPIGMALVALDGRWLKVNRALCALTGYGEHALLSRTFQDITHPDDLDADLEQLQRLLAGEIERYEMEKRYLTACGDVLWGRLAVSLVRDADGQPLHFVSHIQDVSERKQMEQALQRLAEEDPLTGLANRRRFAEELRRQAGRCHRYGERAALLMIDLDDFKAVNDRHGHQTGDGLLAGVATAMRGRLRTTDALGRIGGDEFAALLVNVAPEEAAVVAEQLREAIAGVNVAVADGTTGVTASVGIAFLDESATDPQTAMVLADAAMYRAKAGGRSPQNE